ncbi:MAG: allantoicase [Acidobacteriota bacterium]
MTDFTELPDLAAERLGGTVIHANDEFFAEKENLLLAKPAIFIADRYTDRGKWMDGWETRRRRTPGHDFAVVRLGLAGVVRGVVVDTAFFKGNFPESCSIEACCLDRDPQAEDTAESTRWIEILPRSILAGDSANLFTVDSPLRFTHLRLNIFPDGGVARLRVHGEPMPHWPAVSARLDLAALANGAWVVAASDRFFGPPHSLGLPGPSIGMHDGWETRRRRGPGHDWVIVRLATEGVVESACVDTSHFKGNAPGSCTLEGCSSPDRVPRADVAWHALAPESPLQPNTVHDFNDLVAGSAITHARLAIYPDGGVARLRLYGAATERGRVEASLRWLNALPPLAAATELSACCAAKSWARAVTAARPFATLEELHAASAQAARDMGREDLLEAFSAHATLGQLSESHGSNQEQAGASLASPETRTRLSELNRRYAERFGYVFLLSATGKSGDEMATQCAARLDNEAARELEIAAAELHKITALRLQKLLGGSPK